MYGLGFPRWMGTAMLVFVLIGALASVVGVVAGIVWLVRHVRFV